ncbi:MAG: hypothetical protein KAW93_04830 [Methanogenium sp.]|nr:hypothetical protein [Methanogenium sp.]
MMRKGIGIATLVLAMLVFSLVVPVSADTMVNTTVDIATGGGSTPVIMAKWEQDNTTCLEDGDPGHALPGGQFLPPALFEGTKEIKYFAIVCDEEDGGDLSLVSAYVYHPNNTYFDPDMWDLFKYQIMLDNIGHGAAVQALAQDAYEAGLITIPSGYTWTGDDGTSVMYRLGKGTADVWMGTEVIHYCQPAGNYTVIARAVDRNSNPAADLTNIFNYLEVPCAEFDFESVDYGSVSICVNKWATGNTIFNTADGLPTVRNIGNVPINVKVVRQDPMDFGRDSTGTWDVEFDARLGDTGTVVTYDPVADGEPDQNKILPDALWMCHSEELDFSIHILKGFAGDVHEGTLTLGFETVP